MLLHVWHFSSPAWVSVYSCCVKCVCSGVYFSVNQTGNRHPSLSILPCDIRCQVASQMPWKPSNPYTPASMATGIRCLRDRMRIINDSLLAAGSK